MNEFDRHSHKLYIVEHKAQEKFFLWWKREVVEHSQIIADTVDTDSTFVWFFLEEEGKQHLSAAFRKDDVLVIVAKSFVSKQMFGVEVSGISKADKNRLEQTISRALRQLGYEKDEDGQFVRTNDDEQEQGQG